MMHKIFSTRERERILEHVLANPSRPHRVRAIARTLRISVSSVSVFFSLLNRLKILRRKGNDFYINVGSPETRAIKSLFNISKLNIAPLKNIPGVEGIGLYGSWANGTDKEDSDIDIWVRVDKRPKEEIIAKISRQMNETMKRKVQLLMLDPEKSKALVERDPIFYYSLVYGSVVFYGKSLTD
jgi:predicted nucleotidyltransferase